MTRSSMDAHVGAPGLPPLSRLDLLPRLRDDLARLGVGTLTVFAFSSENWSRPEREVSRLMDLFLGALDKEVTELHANGVCIRFIGDRSAFRPALQEKMSEAEALTAGNENLIANVAVNYGGRWDIVQAAAQVAESVARGELQAAIVGLPVRGFRYLVFASSALATSLAVTTVGVIGFIGLVVPHLVRLIAGSDHRTVLPASALLGGSLLVIADTLARTLIAPRQLPVGALTAAIGVPLFSNCSAQ